MGPAYFDCSDHGQTYFQQQMATCGLVSICNSWNTGCRLFLLFFTRNRDFVAHDRDHVAVETGVSTPGTRRGGGWMKKPRCMYEWHVVFAHWFWWKTLAGVKLRIGNKDCESDGGAHYVHRKDVKLARYSRQRCRRSSLGREKTATSIEPWQACSRSPPSPMSYPETGQRRIICRTRRVRTVRHCKSNHTTVRVFFPHFTHQALTSDNRPPT